jgi:hypothetical protein
MLFCIVVPTLYIPALTCVCCHNAFDWTQVQASTTQVQAPTMLQNEDTQAGPSTPSRKRSRWDTEDISEPADERQQPVKRRTKSRQPKETNPTSDNPVPRPDSSRSNSREFKRPVHSVYVPPRTSHPPITPSRSVYCYERLNSIEEGSYGVVFRAKDKQTGDIVALKKLKLDEEKQGFPITALREINALMVCKHENVVGIREVVVGETLTQCVYPFGENTQLQLIFHACIHNSGYKSFYRHGLYRARPENAADGHAVAVSPVRSENFNASAAVCCRVLPRKMDLASRLEDE